MSMGLIDVLAQVIQNALKNEACPKFTSKLSANGPFADESSIKKGAWSCRFRDGPFPSTRPSPFFGFEKQIRSFAHE
jgi:hypothetical protein